MQFLNQIINDDCLNVLPKIPNGSIDFVLTDPPYLVSYQSRDGRRILNDDNDAWLKPAFKDLYRALAPNSFCVSFYRYPSADRFLTAFRDAGFRVSGHIVFPKCYRSNSYYMGFQHECAYLLTKGRPGRPSTLISDVIPWQYTANRLHPTQKPLSSLSPLIECFSRPGDVILDPFAGSGSTLVAAKELGRQYVGIELDPTYHANAQRRLMSGRAA